MIRLDQRNADIQGTERVFKKVVHGGHNALRFVDRNGLPLRAPNTATLSRLHSSYVLSPRGVPTRKSNHSYSGQLNQAKMQNMVSSLETSSQEMASYTSMHSYGNGLSSAGSGRHFLSTANSQKNRTFGPARSAKSMNKSASSQRTHNRLLVSAPGLEITSNDPNLETTNDSPQGKRLEKEWSALSQCRALKRSSEIVSHRVDRMYFMTGNKLKLQSKYHVEDDDLRHLRELQAARASSRASRAEMREKAQSMMKPKDINEKERLEQIERKLSNIEHRLSHIEEKSEMKDLVDRTHSVHINERIDYYDGESNTSSESGIHEEKEDIETEDEDFIEREMRKRNAYADNDDAVDSQADIVNDERPVSHVEIRQLAEEESEPGTGIQLWDILSHEKGAVYADTMLKLFEVYPNMNIRSQFTHKPKNNYQNANELTLGVPRKVRRAKMKSPQKRVEITPQHEKELIGNAISPVCRYCKCQKQTSKPSDISVTADMNKDHLKQRFPVRKASIKISHQQRVECDCRLDPRRNKGPLLTVTGRQVPLCDRDILYSIA